VKYAILIMNTPESDALTGDERNKWYGEIMTWYEQKGASGELADGGFQLQPPETARTLRASGATDGPFIEAKEVIGGVSALEAPSLDAAAEIAKTWPGVDRGWITIEVRPVIEM
jgi:hypothetical protein